MHWLEVAQKLHTIAQAGLTYSQNPYDLDRYVQLEALAADILANQGGLERSAAETVLIEQGYATPKVDVRAVVFRKGRILMVRESVDGKWSLPGGWADIGESPGEIAVREVREEAGYTVRPTKLLAVLDKAKHDHPKEFQYVYKIFIRCELTEEAPEAASTPHEVLEVGWFSLAELPPLSAPRVTEGQIRRMFEHLSNPDRPADFD